jgi:hypothetical protein
MRAILLILMLAVIGLIAAIATGFLDISQTRSARAPDIDATGNGIVARGGQAPSFDVETGSVSIGAQPQNVTVPVPQVEIRGADAGEPAPASNGAATP